MASALHYLELTELSRRIQAREISPVEATTAQLARIEASDGVLKSYAHVMAEAALSQARTAEAEIMRGEIRGPLHGVPIAVKDLCWTQGVPTAAGMTIYQDFRPAEDATVVRRLYAAGAIILGKLQLTEGAYADHHPTDRAPGEPLERGVLVRCLVERFRRRDGCRTLLRLAGIRHRRFHPVSLRRQRRHRPQADLGPGQPPWRVRAGGDARSHRADGAQRGGLRRDARSHRRQRSATTPPRVPDPVPNYLAGMTRGLRGLRIGVDHAWNTTGIDATTIAAVTAALATVRDLRRRNPRRDVSRCRARSSPTGSRCAAWRPRWRTRPPIRRARASTVPRCPA